MGRNIKPSDKQKMKKHRKGLWSPDEDEKLRNYILCHGFSCWSSVPINAGLQRNSKSCRLRWINYLRPGLKRGLFSIEEEDAIFILHQMLGNKWSQIAQHLPGRTDNEIKNYWHSYRRKRTAKMIETYESTNHAELCQESESLENIKQNIPYNSSFESFGNINQSPTDMDQYSSTVYQSKVLFAEWLSLDQFHAHNADFKVTQNHPSSSYDQESSSHDVLVNKCSFESEMSTYSKSISVDNMLQSAFKFEEQGGMLDYFPGEFDINNDDDVHIKSRLRTSQNFLMD